MGGGNLPKEKVTDVMAAVIAATKVGRKASCAPLDIAAEAFKAEGNAYAEKILRGVVKRMRG